MSLKIDLQGKTALITGATGQLGQAMVNTLARAGADIIIHYRNNEKRATQLKEKLHTLGVEGFTAQADVGVEKDVSRMRSDIQSRFRLPDIVVTNAVSQVFPWETVLNESPKDYEDQFRSCVMQNVLMAKAFVPSMIDNGWGRFIGINTEVAIQTVENQSAYASGKKGMDGVLRVLSREVGSHGITVNQVAPGWTISWQDRQNGTEQQPEYAQKLPLKRRGEDIEVAYVVAFLASKLASYITGAFIPVNGGNTFVGI